MSFDKLRMRGEPVLDQELRALVRERVARLQDQHLEHEHVVERGPSAPRPVRARHRPSESGPKRLELHDRVQTLEVIALRRELLQALVNIEEARLTPHRQPSSVPATITPQLASTREVLGGVQLRERGTAVTHDTVWRFARREGLTVKKRR